MKPEYSPYRPDNYVGDILAMVSFVHLALFVLFSSLQFIAFLYLYGTILNIVKTMQEG